MNFTNFANLSIFIFILFYTKTENSRCLFQSQKCIIIESHPIIYILLYIWCIYEICQYCRCRLRPSASCVCVRAYSCACCCCSTVQMLLPLLLLLLLLLSLLPRRCPPLFDLWPHKRRLFSVAYNYDLLLFYYYHINLSNQRNDEKIKSILNP